MATKSKPAPFSRRLRELREAAGLSIYRLAIDCDVTRSYLGHLEAGTKQPSWEVVCKIADALGAKTDAFR